MGGDSPAGRLTSRRPNASYHGACSFFHRYPVTRKNAILFFFSLARLQQWAYQRERIAPQQDRHSSLKKKNRRSLAHPVLRRESVRLHERDAIRSIDSFRIYGIRRVHNAINAFNWIDHLIN